MVLLRSRVLCRVHDGFRSELRRILRITAKCIFMRSPNLENSMRRTVLRSQIIPMFSVKSALLVPLLYTIAAISVNAANAYICIICKYIFLISGQCEWWAGQACGAPRPRLPVAAGRCWPFVADRVQVRMLRMQNISLERADSAEVEIPAKFCYNPVKRAWFGTMLFCVAWGNAVSRTIMRVQRRNSLCFKIT